MAAEYGININVRTKDEQLKRLQKELNKTDATVKKLASSLERIEKKGKAGSGRPGGPFSAEAIAKRKELAKATKEAAKTFEEYTRGALNFDGANRKGITSTRELATRMKDVAASAGITSKKFELFTQGATKFNFSAQIKSLQRFNESAKITASTFGAMSSGNVPGIAGFSNADISTLLNFAPANTINAIERYLDTLTGVRKQLDISEKEYKDVTGRIKEMNKELEKQRTLLREPTEDKGNRRRERRLRIEERDRLRETLGGRIKRFRRGDKKVRDQVASSALIGGAFPLLFGQGLAASAGGFAGGATGGLLGGQFGFALSLVGTQIGAFIDGLGKKATELGDALRKPSENIEILVQRAGISGTALERQISKLEELGLQATAADIALAEIDEFADVEQLKKLSKSFQELGNTFAKLNTQLLSFVSQGLGDFASALNEIIQGASNAFTFRDLVLSIPESKIEEFNKRVGELIPESKASRFNFIEQGIDRFSKTGNINRAAQLGPEFLTPSIINQLKRDFSPSSANTKVQISQELLDSARSIKIDNLKSEVELEAKRLVQRSEEQDVIRKTNEVRAIESKIALKKFELDKTEEGVRKDKLKDEVEELRLQRELNIAQLRNAEILANPVASAIVDVNNKLRDLMDTQMAVVELSKTIESSFAESFKGIIKGTMSVQDAFRNMFMRIADAFLDMAAQIIAKQIQMKILGIGLNFFMNQGLAPSRGATTGGTDRFGRDFDDPEFGLPLANGGIAKAGRTHLVGERGPELFTPGVTGTVTPNHALVGSTNIVVNVDASGSSVEGDEQGGRELGRLISVAIQSELVQQKRPGGLLA